ncbi:tRNA-splicing endonuclease subunit sen54 N-term-domain-containing protein [Paraphoma chrysanthemicola]|nr:tRNA-splicing endonuclease subunit sen54 N-term-domain-containing protein [Paraphoma chrysanthemicola]
MADEDEELSHLRAPDAGDVDLTEETQDFRFLDKLTAGHDTASLTLPKRGEKDFESHATNRQLDQLEASRQAMHGVLSWQRSHTQKNHVVAMYEPQSNMAYVDKVRSQHFQTIGTNKAGREWLLPEEALFLIERGTLDCRWPVKREDGDETRYKVEEGAPMSLQAAYAAFIGFEGGVGGKLTLEMYNVYAGLKRSGYVVYRTGTWDDDRGDLAVPEIEAQGQEKPQLGVITRFFSEIWRRLSQPTHTTTSEQLAFGPLVKPGLYRNYNDIFRLLQLIPTHDRMSPPSFKLPPSSDNPYRLHFDIYRTTAKFRKSARGTPDFRICVVNARETTIPTGAQINDLMTQVPDDKPKDGEQLYKKLKHGCKNVILAVVDCGIPSYIRLADVPFSDERIYERASNATRGKGGGRGRGGGRGGGRGRGRGRGRG